MIFIANIRSSAMTDSKGDHDVTKATADDSAQIQLRQPVVPDITNVVYISDGRMPRWRRRQSESDNPSHGDANRHTDFHSVANSNFDADIDGIPDSHSHSYSDSDTDDFAQSDTNANSNADSHTYSDPGPNSDRRLGFSAPLGLWRPGRGDQSKDRCELQRADGSNDAHDHDLYRDPTGTAFDWGNSELRPFQRYRDLYAHQPSRGEYYFYRRDYHRSRE